MSKLSACQLAPGPLAAQLAIYLGYLRAGVLGATAVALAFVLPSFLMVWRSRQPMFALAGCRGAGMFYGIGAAGSALCTLRVQTYKANLGKISYSGNFAVLAISTAWTSRKLSGSSCSAESLLF